MSQKTIQAGVDICCNHHPENLKNSVNNRLCKIRNGDSRNSGSHQCKTGTGKSSGLRRSLGGRLKKAVTRLECKRKHEVPKNEVEVNAVPPFSILEGKSKLQNRLHRIRGYVPAEPALPARRADETVHFPVPSPLPVLIPVVPVQVVYPVALGSNQTNAMAVNWFLQLTPAQQVHIQSTAEFIGTNASTCFLSN